MTAGGPTNNLDQSTQPQGVPAHGSHRGGSQLTGPDLLVWELHARLCELVGDSQARADLLGVPVTVDAAWLEGRMLPVLRAQRKKLQAAVARLERDQAAK